MHPRHPDLRSAARGGEAGSGGSEPARSADPGRDRLAGLRPAERRELEDVLRALFECEHHGHPASDARVAGLTGSPRESVLRSLARASASGLAENLEDGWALLPAGREIAVRIMRAHRLIETRLARESSVPPSRWHEVAHAAEHELTRDEVNRLADRLDNPRFDPHGDPIPTREGRIPEPEGQLLLSWRLDDTGVIAHLEDEPPALFARLVATGLFAGMRFRLVQRGAAASVLTVEGRTVTLPAELAAMVRVRALLPSEKAPPSGAARLSDLARGASAEVVTLLPGCIGGERSRLLDLGFVPGSRIEHALQSPFNGPAAYRLRGTLIALRREQADQVLVVPANV